MSDWDCETCHQHVDGPGPWCVLYTEDAWCEPVRSMRQWIRDADSVGDGPLVNALCRELRQRTNDNFVP